VIQDHSGHVTGAEEYGWPWGGGGDHLTNLENFYKTRPDVEKIGAVYPGFRDDSTDLNRCQRWYEATLAAEDEVDQKICRQIYYELISLDTQRADELFDLLEE
jgi:hypothetical protein